MDVALLVIASVGVLSLFTLAIVQVARLIKLFSDERADHAHDLDVLREQVGSYTASLGRLDESITVLAAQSAQLQETQGNVRKDVQQLFDQTGAKRNRRL